MKKVNEYFKELVEQYPYKQAGNRDSYSQYNEGWQDALDLAMQSVKTIQENTIRETVKECLKNGKVIKGDHTFLGQTLYKINPVSLDSIADKLIKEL